jgi:organic radical activating enzyme
VRSLFGKLEGVRSLFGRLRGCDLSFSVSSVSLWFVKKGCLGKLKGCDSEALLQAVRC